MNLSEAYNGLTLAIEQFLIAAMTDHLTPLGSVLALTQEAAKVGTGKADPDVVVFGDLNRFKGLNDQFGHAAGDAAISAVGESLRKVVKDLGATAYRRGGDDFVILLQKSNLENLKAKLGSFKTCTFRFEGITRQTAMSFGYALHEGELDYAGLLARAETACQKAKAQGDGICVEWSPEIERKTPVHLRDRCTSCDAKISVTVPKESAPDPSRLTSCPCCGNELTAHG